MPNEGDDENENGFGGKSSFDETKQSDDDDDDCLLPDLDVLWKIATPEEMTEWQSSGILSLASSVDRTDGFMHLSNAFRVKTTANLYFKGRDDLRLLKIETKNLTQNDTRSVVFADEAPPKRDTSITDGLIYVHYLLVQGKACCAHAYANFASHPLKYDDVVSEVHDLPWNEREGKHEFPASLLLG